MGESEKKGGEFTNNKNNRGTIKTIKISLKNPKKSLKILKNP